ncbi:ribosome-associated translation inhibitor RaiA [Motiliproteus coralliicola]|uniref:Ribosome-associated translation inhibitor RaiA n=1 Tax=Motiliproteus coralliicola TaxID=2283196 RepID=A0A369WTN9_9GAMM|nr:ribosome-associated translation inhibitor RaiA [Motiliproteus coralliicola]RDE24961.1 ribosome-associated translation inhibitor RaiA [Motiliproteus coralliicola]
MKLNINNRQGKVSPALQSKIEEWLEASQDRYGVISSAQINIEQSEREDEVEAILHIKGKDIFAKASGQNLYVAIDTLKDKIDRQLAKAKEKLTNKKGERKPVPTEDEILVDEEQLEVEEG